MEFGNENVRVRMAAGDRISSLPDEIIHHIMSFNDTKYAVQTSVLSSRWKLVWTTLPYLNFSTEQFRILPKFSKFVNQVLSLRNNSVAVSLSVDLHFRGAVDQKFMHKIGNYAMSHNVQKLNIFGYRLKDHLHYDPEFPYCFFSSQSLKQLTVNISHLSYFPFRGSPWDALTTLELNGVCLYSDFLISNRLDLFSKCVSLTSLTLSDWWSDGNTVLMIECPRLVRLTISNVDPIECEILAPNIASLYYKGWCRPFLHRCDGLKSLEKVNLLMRVPIFTSFAIGNEMLLQRTTHQIWDILNETRSAEFVTLDGSIIEFLSKVLDSLDHQLSPFCNLKCLRIKWDERQLLCTKSDLTKVITYLLNSSPTATVSMELPEGL